MKWSQVRFGDVCLSFSIELYVFSVSDCRLCLKWPQTTTDKWRVREQSRTSASKKRKRCSSCSSSDGEPLKRLWLKLVDDYRAANKRQSQRNPVDVCQSLSCLVFVESHFMFTSSYCMLETLFSLCIVLFCSDFNFHPCSCCVYFKCFESSLDDVLVKFCIFYLWIEFNILLLFFVFASIKLIRIDNIVRHQLG